jgi:hypothetical protein
MATSTEYPKTREDLDRGVEGAIAAALSGGGGAAEAAAAVSGWLVASGAVRFAAPADESDLVSDAGC